MNRHKAITIGFSVLLVNATWVWSFPEATLFYVLNVLLHVGLGLGLIGALLLWRKEWAPSLGWKSAPAAGLLGFSGALGAVLCVIGATRPHTLVLVIHIGSGVFGGAGALVVLARAPLRSCFEHWEWPWVRSFWSG